MLPPVVTIPQLPPAPPPAECTRAALVAFAPELAGLPHDYVQMSPNDRARALLRTKASDSVQYRTLRAQALRCAR